MGVGAQNYLVEHQSFARKMTWKLPDKSIVFFVKLRWPPKQKEKKGFTQIEPVFLQICGDLQKKTKKVLHSHWDGFCVQRLEYFTRQTCPNDMKLPKILMQYCPKNMKSPEILTQNRPKYMKLPKILPENWTPYTNRGGQCPPAPPPPTPVLLRYNVSLVCFCCYGLCFSFSVLMSKLQTINQLAFTYCNCKREELDVPLHTFACVLGLALEHSCPWPREGLPSEGAVLGLGFFCGLGLGFGLEPFALNSTSGHCQVPTVCSVPTFA